MNPKMIFAITLGVGALLFQSPLVLADEKGQEDLDKATVAKLTAKTLADLEKVADLCESALEKGLDDAGSQFAKQLWSATLLEQAEVMLDPILKGRPDARAPFLRQQALTRLEKAVELDDKLVDAFLLIARLRALRTDEHPQARKAVDRVIELAADDKTLLSDAYLLKGNLAEDDEQQLANYTQSIEANPGNLNALQARGLYYMTTEQFEKAVEDFERVLERNNNDPQAYVNLAEAFMRAGKSSDAVESLDRLIENNPEMTQAYVLRSRLHILTGQIEDAMKDLDHILDVDRRKMDQWHLSALMIRARLLIEQDKLQDAKRDIELALMVQPGLIQGLLLRSMIAASEGNFGPAAKDMELLVRSDPTNIEWQIRLAMIYDGDERPSKALDVYNRVLRRQQDNFLALRGRADVYLTTGKHQKAKQDYERCLELRAEDDTVLNNLAWLLATSNDEALRDGQRSIELGIKACELTDYKAAHILSTLAAGYAETGDFETAIKWSTKAVELSETNKEGLQKELDSYLEKKPWREHLERKDRKTPKRGGGAFDL